MNCLKPSKEKCKDCELYLPRSNDCSYKRTIKSLMYKSMPEVRRCENMIYLLKHLEA